jgi:hypothetical protein
MSRRQPARSIDQLELTDVGTLAPEKRRRVADTSRAAAARASHRTGELRELILATIVACFRNPKMNGATSDEVAMLTAPTEREAHDFQRTQEIRRRTSDLHIKLGQIRDTGVRRENLAGNAMIVWAPVDSAEVRHG